MGSVFLPGYGQLTQLVVEMARWAWWARTAPDPAAAEWRSGVPATTTTPGPSPRSSATAGPDRAEHAEGRDQRGKLPAGDARRPRTSTGS